MGGFIGKHGASCRIAWVVLDFMEFEGEVVSRRIGVGPTGVDLVLFFPCESANHSLPVGQGLKRHQAPDVFIEHNNFVTEAFHESPSDRSRHRGEEAGKIGVEADIREGCGEKPGSLPDYLGENPEQPFIGQDLGSSDVKGTTHGFGGLHGSHQVLHHVPDSDGLTAVLGPVRNGKNREAGNQVADDFIG
jgi:hypothetical protein